MSTGSTQGTCDGCGEVKDIHPVQDNDRNTANICDDCETEAQAAEGEAAEGMPDIEIEELWQPNEEQQENLAKKIDWKTAIKYLHKLADKDSQKAFDALVNLKDLVGMDRFADIMVEFGPYGSAELYEKVARHGIKKQF